MDDRDYFITTKDNIDVYVSIRDDIHTTEGYICVNDDMSLYHRFDGFLDNEIIYRMVELANEEWKYHGVNLNPNEVVDQIANEYDLWLKWEEDALSMWDEDEEEENESKVL